MLSSQTVYVLKPLQISRWGKKMAVVVDKPFWDSLGTISEVPHISNSDIVWFVVRYVPRKQGSFEDPPYFQIELDNTYKCTLDRAVEGLTGGTPVSLNSFEDELKARLEKLPASEDLSQLAAMSFEYDEATSLQSETSEDQGAESEK
jgi:hypothetical protein